MVGLEAITKSEALEEYIVKHILPKYKAGEKIPSELILAQELNTSRPTVHKIFSNLTAKGILYRENGVGTFISGKSCKNKVVTAVLPSVEALNPSIEPSWFNSQYILEGFCSKARPEGVITDIMYLHPDAQPLEQGLEILLQNQSDVFIFTGIGGYLALIEKLNELGKHVVVRHSTRHASIHNVYGLIRQAIRKAVSELIARGHRNIAFFGGPDFSGEYEKERLLGYTEALEVAGIAIRPELIRPCSGFSRDACLATRKLFDEKIVPDAVFGGTDLRSFGIMQAIAEKGLRIPDDIAIFGSDNLPESSMQHPPLSSIDYPLHLMGRIMFDIVKEITEKPVSGIISRSVECKFIQRESC